MLFKLESCANIEIFSFFLFSLFNFSKLKYLMNAGKPLRTSVAGCPFVFSTQECCFLETLVRKNRGDDKI